MQGHRLVLVVGVQPSVDYGLGAVGHPGNWRADLFGLPLDCEGLTDEHEAM